MRVGRIRIEGSEGVKDASVLAGCVLGVQENGILGVFRVAFSGFAVVMVMHALLVYFIMITHSLFCLLLLAILFQHLH